MNAAIGTTSATTGSSAATEALRGAPSTAESSPSSAPGPRTASTISSPCSVSEKTFTRPETTMTTVEQLSPSRNSDAPAGQRRCRPRWTSAARSAGSSRAMNSSGSASAMVTFRPGARLGPE